MRFMRQIDGLRAFAVAAVLFHHFVSQGLELGTLGVILFFVISGFLITGILLESKSQIASGALTFWKAIRLFYIRRFLRIFPLYFLVLGLLWLFNVGSVRELIGWLASYTINIWIALHHQFPRATGHFWSLAVEEQFYILWPFIVLLLPRRFLRPLMFAFLLSAVGFRVIGKLVFHMYPTINALTLAQLDSLSCGGLLALRNPADTRLLRRVGTWLSPLLLAELVMNYLHIAATLRLVSLELLCALCSAALVSYAAEGMTGAPAHLLSLPPVTYLGRISYGIYVYHLPMYILIPHRSIAAIMTVAVASVSWYAFERPINLLKRYFEPTAASKARATQVVQGT